jgi:hypothetical protein
MNQHRRLLLAATGLLTIVALYEATRQYALRERAELARIELTRKTSALEAEQRPHLMEASVAATADAPSSVPPTTPAPGETASPSRRPARDASQLVALHPEIRARFQTAFHARFDREYRALFERLALPPEQRERFKQRLFEDQLDQLDLRWTGKSFGAERNAPEAQALRRQQEKALAADLASILGPEGNRALADFRRANGTRSFVDNVATNMSLDGQAMTRAQSDRLLQTIAEASQRYKQGGNAIPWDADWDAIMAQAPSFLSPAQVDILRIDGDHYVRRFVWKLPAFYAQRQTAEKP